MALTSTEIKELTRTATESLDIADERWSLASATLRERALREKAMATPYPGVPFIDTTPEVREYMVLMADMRDSTKHLRTTPPASSTVENGLHRVYMETAGLLPTLAHLIRHREGRVTEYLGDAVLAFVEVSDSKTSREYTAAVDLAEDCLTTCNGLVSKLLAERYGLPGIRIGVGVSIGQAIITTMGLREDERPIAFGTPVYEVAGLCKESNLVLISPMMEDRWPSGPRGKRHFEQFMAKNRVLGYKTWVEK